MSRLDREMETIRTAANWAEANQNRKPDPRSGDPEEREIAITLLELSLSYDENVGALAWHLRKESPSMPEEEGKMLVHRIADWMATHHRRRPSPRATEHEEQTLGLALLEMSVAKHEYRMQGNP